jgi:hypothetical protein
MAETDMAETDGTARDMAETDGTARDMAETDGTARDMAETDGTARDMAETDGTARETAGGRMGRIQAEASAYRRTEKNDTDLVSECDIFPIFLFVSDVVVFHV